MPGLALRYSVHSRRAVSVSPLARRDLAEVDVRDLAGVGAARGELLERRLGLVEPLLVGGEPRLLGVVGRRVERIDLGAVDAQRVGEPLARTRLAAAEEEDHERGDHQHADQAADDVQRRALVAADVLDAAAEGLAHLVAFHFLAAQVVLHAALDSWLPNRRTGAGSPARPPMVRLGGLEPPT